MAGEQLVRPIDLASYADAVLTATCRVLARRWSLPLLRPFYALRPRREFSFVGRSLPEFTRVTLQEVDDLLAHRAVLVGVTDAGGEEQFPCAAEARLELRL